MSFRRYCVITIAALTLFLGGITALNFSVDPLLLYARKDAGSRQLSRVDQFPNMRLYKPLHVSRLQPEIVIIGSSRSGTLRPGPVAGKRHRSYNFSMPGITLFELESAIRHAQAAQSLQQLIIGLDFDAFTSSRPHYRPGFDTRRMLTGSDDRHTFSYWRQRLRDAQSTLLSPHILGETLTALTGSGPANREYFPDGSWRATSTRLTGRGGYRYVASNMAKAAQSADYNRKLLLNTYRDLLSFCYDRGIATTLILTPVHVSFVELWYQFASEAYWRDIHHTIVAINAELARDYNRAPFPIWGFGHEGDVVDEPIYLARDTEKAWFNDGVHYRPRLARKIQRALAEEEPGFGLRLNEGNIEGYLDRIDTLRRKFVKKNAEQVRDLLERAGLSQRVPQPASLPDGSDNSL